VDPAAGEDLVTLLDGFQEIAVLLGPFLLGPNQQEVEYQKHQQERRQSSKHASRAAGTCTALGRHTHCVHKIHLVSPSSTVYRAGPLRGR